MKAAKKAGSRQESWQQIDLDVFQSASPIDRNHADAELDTSNT